ncbi:transcription factor Adf-1-like [Stegodyphus dumicola]|uniref:transcription factor Adf-1-like n=1 Tax=Stegodyphus dumicola TaxID=202533 RepID=UPI0015B08732|nr:transcription factor Adf-1-like [Stegodyphus dumicola]
MICSKVLFTAFNMAAAFNDEILINEIRQYPLLWDHKLKDYRNKERKELIWIKISNSIGYDVNTIRHRWKCLRDRYVRECKALKSKNRSGSEATTPKFGLYEELSFLRDTVSHRPTTSNIIDEPSLPIEDTMESFNDSINFDESLNEEAACSSQLVDGGEILEPPLKKQKKKDIDSKLSTYLDLAAAARLKSRSQTSDDEHFLLSLRDDFGAVPREKKK